MRLIIMPILISVYHFSEFVLQLKTNGLLITKKQCVCHGKTLILDFPHVSKSVRKQQKREKYIFSS